MLGKTLRWKSISLFLLAFVVLSQSIAQAAEKPNIVIIYADDVGYGDLGCYGATRVKTPNLDRLAASGIKFTDGHATSASCTPSRYALLTGQYPWRKQGVHILTGDANLIIDPAQTTLPSVMQKAGYTTAVVGKWHLGLGKGKIDWNTEIKPGPREIGFDYSFLIPATGDRVPCVYVENQKVVGLDPNDPITVSYKEKVGNDPTGKENPDLLKMQLSRGHDSTIVNGISRIGWITGGKAARWVDEDMADTIDNKAVQFIEQNQKQPFFLYFATHDIHVPRVPHQRYFGKSQLGIRGDAIMQLDTSVGQIMEALDRLKLTDNTLVIFSSDNGPVLDDGYADGAEATNADHRPAGPWRGRKYSILEGGTRVPFIVSWPGHVKPGSSDALMCQLDFLASLAKLAGQEVPNAAQLDSEDHLDALLGQKKAGRTLLVEHAHNMVLRQAHWKYIPASKKEARTGVLATDQLYQLESDPFEIDNLADRYPELVKEMAAELKAIVEK
ncbi:MAG: arylsulfatase [Planctomycetota bacterium]|nr:arylsulfatase [Planctomycetota bacterium]